MLDKMIEAIKPFSCEMSEIKLEELGIHKKITLQYQTFNQFSIAVFLSSFKSCNGYINFLHSVAVFIRA